MADFSLGEDMIETNAFIEFKGSEFIYKKETGEFSIDGNYAGNLISRDPMYIVEDFAGELGSKTKDEFSEWSEVITWAFNLITTGKG